MNPEEALQLLDNVAGMAPVNRATHVQVQMAINVLKATIKPVDIPKDNKKK